MKAKKGEDEALLFWCPGCGEYHAVITERGRSGPCWEWNGSLERPTIKPSILVHSVWPIEDGKPVHPFKYKGSYPPPEGICDPFICHSYVTEGRIQFLTDCTHPLAGQTVELPEVED